ncbi:hypothetical protein CEP54_010059 [Fusarium duplospermum]|uniref:O-methyltransferase C-terminal domain-containing protein n=1 Tax=Fusarium duplospermum TaxID=1325734 RepID=A0A428PM29_9HYPO|nr:hypothetical protein CEP54_010059 [Fusarium duplospermum]
MRKPVDLSLATRPSNPDAVPQLIEEMGDLSKNLQAGDEEARHELFLKARSLIQAVSTPRELMVQHTWADPGLNAALITGVDVGLWKLMVQNGVDKPQKAEDLAQSLDMDPILLGRLMRHVCAMGHLEEIGQDEYKLNNFSKSLSLDVIGDGYLALSIGLGPQTNHHNQSPDAPLVVDVAGGLGHDINEFKKFYPEHPGKLILQDLPVVINDVKGIDPSIELMGHDFLTEQPIKGARAYFMHSIMHDWPDDVCRKILAPLAEAMKPGYSKLLIFECVIPKTGAYWEATAGDILMMTQLSAVERTEDHWHQLIEESGLGLKIVKFWKCGQSDVENVIECELV